MKPYIVEMNDCTVRWRIPEADSPEDAEEKAWAMWEAGHEPTDLDCNGARVRVREVPPVTLGQLLKAPEDAPPVPDEGPPVRPVVEDPIYLLGRARERMAILAWLDRIALESARPRDADSLREGVAKGEHTLRGEST